MTLNGNGWRVLSLSVVTALAACEAQAASQLTGDLPRRAAPGFRLLALEGGGVAVRDVVENAPAARAGLRAGDRLVAVQGRVVAAADDGQEQLRSLKGGRPARLVADRDGRRVELAFTPEPLPLEDLPGVDTVYGVVDTPDGSRLRSVVTRPVGVTGPLPAIFFTQWVSCDGIEPLGGGAWNDVLRAVITRSGAIVLRVDRSSGGDSEGPGCDALDYDTEVAHYRHAFERLTRDQGIDPTRIVVFGMSLGSTTAPLVAQGHRVAGVIASGGGGLTYFERMLAFDRLGFERGGTPPSQIDARVRESAAFHAEYLLRGRRPEAIAAERPELAGVWRRIRGTGDGTHYGRPYAWHQQAARRDFAAAWAAIDAPVLVVYGAWDQFEPPHAHHAIADAVDRARPGGARAVEVPRMNHFYRVFATAADAFADERGEDAPELATGPILEWLRGRLAVRPASVP